MTILFIDHHDSFVHNLINWFKNYSVFDVHVLNYDNLPKTFTKQFFSKFGAVIFSPGPGHPSQYEKSIALYKCLPKNIPFLGVCLGYQLMLLAHHAKIAQVAKNPIHGAQINLIQKEQSRFFSSDVFLGNFVLYNSLGIKVSDSIFKDNFTLLAYKDKFSQAAEHKILPHIGVQFHPESFASRNGHLIMSSFLRLIEC